MKTNKKTAMGSDDMTNVWIILELNVDWNLETVQSYVKVFTTS